MKTIKKKKGEKELKDVAIVVVAFVILFQSWNYIIKINCFLAVGFLAAFLIIMACTFPMNLFEVVGFFLFVTFFLSTIFTQIGMDWTDKTFYLSGAFSISMLIYGCKDTFR